MESEEQKGLMFNTNFFFPYQKIIESISIGGCNNEALLKLKEAYDERKNPIIPEMSNLVSFPSPSKKSSEWKSIFEVIFKINHLVNLSR